MLQIQRKKDERVAKACTHSCADIPGGVTVCSADLVPGRALMGGSVIGKDSAGLYHVIKTARLEADAAADATSLQVAKGHHLKKGDIVMADKGKKAVAIASIDTTGTAHDTLTLPTGGLGEAVKKGAAIAQGKAAADAGVFPHDPAAVVEDSHDVESLSNHLVSAVTIGQFKAGLAPGVTAEMRKALPAIVFV